MAHLQLNTVFVYQILFRRIYFQQWADLSELFTEQKANADN